MDHYLRQWLKDKKPTLKTSTYRDYYKILEGQIIPQFGHFMLAEFKRKHAREWAASLTCSNKRLANILSPLRSALSDAVHDELINTNPLLGWRYRKPEADIKRMQDEPDPFTMEEQALILDNLADDSRPLIQFAFWTGLRTSELVALEWTDIDWAKKTVRIDKVITQASRGKAEPPKTAAGIRDVTLLPAAEEALNQQWEFSRDHESGRVFLNPRTHSPWTGDQAIRKTLWAPALKRAGVRYRRQYQTRHTFASMMVSAGEPLAWVSNQMGHTDVIITARVYANWINSAYDQAGQKALRLYWQDKVD
nr:site-specific integrase [Larsenimonas suaedae]